MEALKLVALLVILPLLVAALVYWLVTLSPPFAAKATALGAIAGIVTFLVVLFGYSGIA